MRRRGMNPGCHPRRDTDRDGQKLSRPSGVARKAISRAFGFFLSTEIVDKKKPVDTVRFM
jgi:hypothetical protein